MKNINNFIGLRINEYRTPGAKGKKSDIANVNMDKIEGEDAEKNGTGGKMGFEEPVDNTAQKVEIDKSLLGKNEKRLLMKFKAEDDFFIIGKAGWGKTSIINQFAEKFNMKVITFYLDKCEAVDLGGQPLPTQGKDGKPQIVQAAPAFAQKIAENPKQKFLLFFDEMNQAAPDVMNALMPIVLEHEIAGTKYDNFFCGAAGNFESENGAVNELSAPLRSRFKPLITWETDTDEAWSNTFKYLHKQWDDKVSKKFMDELEAAASCFENPRELEQKLLDRYIYKMIKNKDNFDSDEWLDHLQRLVKDNLSRSQEAQIEKLAESIYSLVENGGKEPEKKEGGRRGEKKDINLVPENVKNAVKHAMKFGFIEQKEGGKTVKYGISRENIGSVVDEEDCNAEMLERLINKYEADGIKFKFEKDKEWKDVGYKDPEED